MAMLTKSIITELIEGDESAFTKVYEQYHQGIFLYCYKHTRAKEIAEELCGDIFLRFWEARGNLDPERELKPYLLTIAKNVTYTWLKRTLTDQRMKTEFKGRYLAAQQEARHDEVIAAAMDLSLLRKLVATMPHKRRRTFELCKFEGMSYAEAAKVLSVSRETIKEHMSLAQKDIGKLARSTDFIYLFLPFLWSLNNFF